MRLTVGIAGHREIPSDQTGPVRAQFEALLRALRDWSPPPGGCDPDRPQLTILSQLAIGADQLAAQAALDLGLPIAAVLPFDRDTYGQDFEGAEHDRFRALLERASASWSLPCAREDAEAGYALAGSLMLGQADILIAFWNGAHARGRGGTGEVVNEAIRRGIPVLHIGTAGGKVRILWGAFDGIGTERLDSQSVPFRPFDAGTLGRTLTAVLAPPAAPDQRHGLALYLAERERRTRLRFEYPLLLALAGIRSLSGKAFRVDAYHETTRLDWSPLHTELELASLLPSEGFAALERAFSWADRLADHYAQTYRSGTILNYLFAAAAVVVALLGIVLPQAKLWLTLSELLLVSGLVANTWTGTRREWHRRWLDYRYLAEQLRPMRSLKLLGAASAAEAWNARAGRAGRWTDWYAAAVWRQIGLPPTIPSSARLREIVDRVAAHEIAPQVAYHHANAHRMEHLDHRLHTAGTWLFVATILTSVIAVIGYLAGIEFIHANGKVLTFFSAAFPTLGAALFGIRGHSDFAAAARRSEETGARLQRSAARLAEDPITLPIAVRLVEDAAAAMSDDLGEWRTTYRHRKLAIPS